MNPQGGYIQYIVNPKSGASSSKWLAGEFKDYLVENGYDVRVEFTKSLEHACQLATKAAVDYQCALVVGAGGDGTLREILHGLEGTNKLFMPIPCGTENLLANELEGMVPEIHIVGDAKQPRNALEAIKEGLLVGLKI